MRAEGRGGRSGEGRGEYASLVLGGMDATECDCNIKTERIKVYER